MNTPIFRFVVATRENRANFFERTATGRSLSLYNSYPIELDLYDLNTEGLPTIYNRSIEKAKINPAILIFAHDDLYLVDFFWAPQILNALTQFDIIGVAGNKRRLPKQPSWFFVDDSFKPDNPSNFSGIVGHGKGFPPRNLSTYGPPCQEVTLLDGLFLVCKSSILEQHNIRFDERFDFHFYDLDFCRQAEQKGLRMGTWNISLIHESGGNFNSPQWHSAKKQYFDKWGD